jgi:hypothetical protein
MGIFGRSRKPEHRAGVVYVYLKNDDMPPSYSAVCRCGWFAEPVNSDYPDPVIEEQMACAAQAHDPAADTSVGFPIDKPPKTRRLADS